MSRNLLWYISNNQILTPLKTKNNFIGQLPSIWKTERKLSTLPECEHNTYNKSVLHFCLLSDTELNILNELSNLIFISTLESCYYLLHFLLVRKLILRSKQEPKIKSHFFLMYFLNLLFPNLTALKKGFHCLWILLIVAKKQTDKKQNKTKLHMLIYILRVT